MRFDCIVIFAQKHTLWFLGEAVVVSYPHGMFGIKNIRNYLLKYPFIWNLERICAGSSYIMGKMGFWWMCNRHQRVASLHLIKAWNSFLFADIIYRIIDSVSWQLMPWSYCMEVPPNLVLPSVYIMLPWPITVFTLNIWTPYLFTSLLLPLIVS